MTYGLVADAVGTHPDLDPYAPEPAISAPVPAQTISGCSYTIQGTASDYYSGVAQVEVSTDNGSTWTVAQGTTTWSLAWTIPGDGPYTLRVRALDNAGNTGSPATGVAVTVQGCTPATVTATATATAIPPTVTATATPVPPTATATATACAIQFSDVTDPAAYYYTSVYYLACRGVVGGYGDGTFRPYNNTTRGQLSKIIVLAYALPIQSAAADYTFADAPTGSTFFAYIETAAARGLVSGYACGGTNPQTGVTETCDSASRPYYRPDNLVTRGQLTKIVVGAAQQVQGWTLRNPATPSFSDVPAGSTFYQYVETAVCHGVLGGYADSTFRPNNSATRGQIAKIATNAVTAPAGGCGP
jgi:hypothetical protein